MSGEDFIGGIGALLVVAPHPDDEVLGCGWLMRAVSVAGGRVIVAWLTDGGGSHGPGQDREALVARRRQEAMDGLAALSIVPAAAYYLGARDGDLADHATPAADAAWLQEICERHAIDTVVVTAHDDGHADHRAASALVRRLNGPRMYVYPVSTRYDGAAAVAEEADGAICVGPQDDDGKRRALRCHASQSAEGGALYPMTPAAIERFCTEPELFYPVSTAT